MKKSTIVEGRPARAHPQAEVVAPPWTFLTNHAHVLLCIAQDPEARVRDLAARVGVTERAVHRILTELEEAGYLKKERDGRRNHYEVRGALPLRHPVERHCQLDDLIKLVAGSGSRSRAAGR
jgi:DNA-binding transcriptional ArsR family regulator